MELAAHAKSIGATSVSSMPPYVGCTKTFDVVKDFYTRFCAAAAPLPVVGYQIPTITGVNLNTAQMGELMEIDGFCGFKYTEGDLYVTLHGGYIDRTNRQRLIEAQFAFYFSSNIAAAAAVEHTHFIKKRSCYSFYSLLLFFLFLLFF